ncbi:MAG: YceI family protein [Deltaproteobacteria bacterium]|nr:YceI family protein [Deltaproteobacteria bacterium]
MRRDTARKTRIRHALILLLALPAAAGAEGEGRDALVIDSSRSEVRFFLDAPRHGVEGRSRAVEGGVQVRGGALLDAQEGVARLQVASLHAGNRLIDRNMRGALDADHHPEILFEATRFEPAGEAAPEGAPWRGVVTGNLTVRGVARPAAFDVEATRQGAALHATGSAVFTLTEFGVDPPRFMGFLRVKDWVRVEFDILAAPEADGGPPSPIATPPEAP